MPGAPRTDFNPDENRAVSEDEWTFGVLNLSGTTYIRRPRRAWISCRCKRTGGAQIFSPICYYSARKYTVGGAAGGRGASGGHCKSAAAVAFMDLLCWVLDMKWKSKHPVLIRPEWIISFVTNNKRLWLLNKNQPADIFQHVQNINRRPKIITYHICLIFQHHRDVDLAGHRVLKIHKSKHLHAFVSESN